MIDRLTPSPSLDVRVSILYELFLAARKHPFLLEDCSIREQFLTLHLAHLRNQSKSAARLTPHLTTLLTNIKEWRQIEADFCLKLCLNRTLSKQELEKIHPCLIRYWNLNPQLSRLPEYISSISELKIYFPLDEPLLQAIHTCLSQETLCLETFSPCQTWIDKTMRAEAKTPFEQRVLAILVLGALKLKQEAIARKWLKTIDNSSYAEVWNKEFCLQLLNTSVPFNDLKIQILQLILWHAPLKTITLAEDQEQKTLDTILLAGPPIKAELLIGFAPLLTKQDISKQKVIHLLRHQKVGEDPLKQLSLLVAYKVQDPSLWATVLQSVLSLEKSESDKKACLAFLDCLPSAKEIYLDCWQRLLSRLSSYPFKLIKRIVQSPSFQQAIEKNGTILDPAHLTAVFAAQLALTRKPTEWLTSKEELLDALPVPIANQIERELFIPILDRMEVFFSDITSFQEVLFILDTLIDENTPAKTLDPYLQTIVSSLSLYGKGEGFIQIGLVLNLLKKYKAPKTGEANDYHLAYALMRHGRTRECCLQAACILCDTLELKISNSREFNSKLICPLLDHLVFVRDPEILKKTEEILTLISQRDLLDRQTILRYLKTKIDTQFSNLTQTLQDSSRQKEVILTFIKNCHGVRQLDFDEQQTILIRILELGKEVFFPCTNESDGFNRALRACFRWVHQWENQEHRLGVRKAILSWVQRQRPNDFSIDTVCIIAAEMIDWIKLPDHNAFVGQALEEMIFYFRPTATNLTREIVAFSPVFAYGCKQQIFQNNRLQQDLLGFYLNETFREDITTVQLKECFQIVIAKLTGPKTPFICCQYAAKLLTTWKDSYELAGAKFFFQQDKAILDRLNTLRKKSKDKDNTQKIFSFYCTHFLQNTDCEDFLIYDAKLLDHISYHICRDPLLEDIIDSKLACDMILYHASTYETIASLEKKQSAVVEKWQSAVVCCTRTLLGVLKKKRNLNETRLELFEELLKEASLSTGIAEGFKEGVKEHLKSKT